MYRGGNKGLYVLLSRTQAGPGKTAKQEQEEISRNHEQTFICLSVVAGRNLATVGHTAKKDVLLFHSSQQGTKQYLPENRKRYVWFLWPSLRPRIEQNDTYTELRKSLCKSC